MKKVITLKEAEKRLRNGEVLRKQDNYYGYDKDLDIFYKFKQVGENEILYTKFIDIVNEYHENAVWGYE